jgi:hypothetical protein
MEFSTLCCDKLTVINVFSSNTTNLLNETLYYTCFGHPWLYSGVKLHLGIKLPTFMPEGVWGWPKHVACSVGFNKFVTFDSSK